MPGAARLGDKSQVKADAHGCPACPHPGTGPLVTGSSNVFTNGKPQARLDDLGIHAVCCGPNNFQVAKGSPTVYINGKPAARMQDKTKHCGGDGNLIEGSPDVLLDDGAGGQGLGSYVVQALQILLQQGTQLAKAQPPAHSDTHRAGSSGTAAPVKTSQPQVQKGGSITAARWSVQRAHNGQDVELHVETKDAQGSLTIEIWAQSADRTQDQKVKTETASAAPSVKKKVKLDIPPAAAAKNECLFYFVVKDAKGGELKSEVLFVDRTPLKFSV